MSRSQTSVATQLQAAWRAGDEVKIRRSLATGEKGRGFIVGMSEVWALVAALSDDVRLDGFSALRIQDVRILDRRTAARSLTARLLKVDADWPLHPPEGVDLSSTRSLIQTAADRFGLVGLSYEEHAADALFIGVPVRVTKRNRLELQTVDPQAEWDPGVMTWPLRDITRIDFDSAYNRALLRLAGPPLANG